MKGRERWGGIKRNEIVSLAACNNRGAINRSQKPCLLGCLGKDRMNDNSDTLTRIQGG